MALGVGGRLTSRVVMLYQDLVVRDGERKIRGSVLGGGRLFWELILVAEKRVRQWCAERMELWNYRGNKEG